MRQSLGSSLRHSSVRYRDSNPRSRSHAHAKGKLAQTAPSLAHAKVKRRASPPKRKPHGHRSSHRSRAAVIAIVRPLSSSLIAISGSSQSPTKMGRCRSSSLIANPPRSLCAATNHATSIASSPSTNRLPPAGCPWPPSIGARSHAGTSTSTISSTLQPVTATHLSPNIHAAPPLAGALQECPVVGGRGCRPPPPGTAARFSSS
jgi:hypothetical protein